MEYMRDWLNEWIMAHWTEYIWAIGIFLVFLLLRKLFTTYIFSLLQKISSRTRADWDNTVLEAFKKPIRLLFVTVGIYLAWVTLPFDGEAVNVVMYKLFRSSTIFVIGWGLFNLTGSSSLWLEKMGRRLNFEMDKIVIPFLSKVLRILVVVLCISVIAQEWDYNVSSLVAGLGLGGLAFALAARETIANIFGGLVIVTEKPFSLGDWIESPSVEGTVEEIRFRSTRVRTFAQAMVTIPNATLAHEPITNWSRMGKRRITFHLGVAYSTPRSKIEACVRRIHDMLETHPDIHKETIFVHFDKFNASSLDIFLYFFTQTTSWSEYLRVKEDCNLQMMRILEEEGVSMAFPSTSIYFENKLETESAGPSGGRKPGV